MLPIYKTLCPLCGEKDEQIKFIQVLSATTLSQFSSRDRYRPIAPRFPIDAASVSQNFRQFPMAGDEGVDVPL